MSFGERPPRGRPGGRGGGRRPTLRERRRRLIYPAIALVVLLAVAVSALSGGSLTPPPRALPAPGAGRGDLFRYVPAQEADFLARATAGNAQPLFTQSPGGAMATAARVAALRPLIDRATAGTGVSPDLLEALVFVESAGRAQVIAGNDPASAAGLTQILAATGQTLLGMHIDLARSRRLSAAITAVGAGTRRGTLAPLLTRRAAIDERFAPARALAATVRYLGIAEAQFHRWDLAFESYHMGIGNLHQVLGDYDGGIPVSYPRLYFDVAPDRHAAAFRRLAGFGDESSLYYWRLLGAASIMRLYRHAPATLRRLAGLATAASTNALVLHPPDHTPAFADAAALSAAYQSRTLVPLPANSAALGLGVDRAMGAGSGASRALYRGLRPGALRLLITLAARVRGLAGGAGSLGLAATVTDRAYAARAGVGYPTSSTGWGLRLSRHYSSAAQAGALQDVLDRLQSLNLLAWTRDGSVLDLVVAGDAAVWLRR
ncbi:MAG: hypothetical protein M3022_11500 [Actinomycetota bacterium]|nr:hypothetical protein [Actinomycetota bacterium]